MAAEDSRRRESRRKGGEVDGNVDSSPAMIVSRIIHVLALLLLLPMPYSESRAPTLIRGTMGESATSSSSSTSMSSKIPSMSTTKTSTPNRRHIRCCNSPLIPLQTSAFRVVSSSSPSLVGEVPIPRIDGIVVAVLPAMRSQCHLGQPPRPTHHC